MLNIQRKANRITNLLIALFVFFHSIMIAELGLYFSNYRFEMPHSLFASVTFSFLYGPLLYFYFKRTTLNYRFKLYDILHLIPSFFLLIYIYPYYLLSSEEKLFLMLNFEKYLMPGTNLIFILKSTSLIVYAILIRNVYTKSLSKKTIEPEFRVWQNRMSNFFNIYVLSYLIYSFSFLNIANIPYLSYIQGVVLSALVLYIAFTAFSRPMLFFSVPNEEPLVPVLNLNTVVPPVKLKEKIPAGVEKYQKSGLTFDLSLELKEDLLSLLKEEKVFKINNLTLEMLSQRLNTSRHNTSQVINEHFNMNFFELINQYRIKEAKHILENDLRKSMNIIDVAYEVGYNNKVTFNKCFKKETLLTPSQYRELHKREMVNIEEEDNPTENDRSSFTNNNSRNSGGTNLFSGSGVA